MRIDQKRLRDSELRDWPVEHEALESAYLRPQLVFCWPEGIGGRDSGGTEGKAGGYGVELGGDVTCKG
jgi:hypothetical protein